MVMLYHQVDLLFKDASIGNAISLAVAHISILNDRDFGGVKSEGEPLVRLLPRAYRPNFSEMLKKFCQWQQTYGTKYKHDTSVLLTRETICRTEKNQECNTIGVAGVGSMCNPSASCSIVRDKGLSTSYTIAHELGHVLRSVMIFLFYSVPVSIGVCVCSMPHDDDMRCVKYSGGVKETNIMSYTLQNGKKPWSWSKCSKHFLTEFLE